MATMLLSPLHARLTGQAARRGLIPRVPTAEALLADVETWLRSTFSDAVRSIERPVREQGEAELTVELHPAAPATRHDRVGHRPGRGHRGDRDRRPGLPPLRRPGPRADWAWISRSSWERAGEEVRDPLSGRDARDLRRTARRRARLPDLARSLAGRGPGAPGVRRGAHPARSAGRRPLPPRRRDPHRPRPTRHGVARRGRDRHADRDRRDALVGGRDRWRVPAEPRPVPDVDRGPLADAGDEERARAVRRGPSAAVARRTRTTRTSPTRGGPGRSWWTSPAIDDPMAGQVRSRAATAAATRRRSAIGGRP